MRRWAWVWLVFSGSAVALPATAAETSRVERPGTIGIGAFGAYGTVVGDSRFGLQFHNGGGYGLDLRYVVGPHWSAGLTFQNHVYEPEASVVSPVATDVRPDKLTMTGLMASLYYYRQRGQDISNYITLGVGFYRPEVHFKQEVNGQEAEAVSFPGESLAVTAGMGLEIFIKENWGIQVAGRAIAYMGDGISEEEALNPDSGAESHGNWSVGLHGQAGLFYYLIK